MPLVHIHLIKGAYSVHQIKILLDTIQSVMQSHFAAPARDRYQILTQHSPYEIICQDTNLPNLTRSQNLVFLQIFQQGRDAEMKQSMYEELMRRFREMLGLEDGDLIVSVVANERQDWSFGGGRAQFLTGEL